jgi:hypothetical protein
MQPGREGEVPELAPRRDLHGRTMLDAEYRLDALGDAGGELLPPGIEHDGAV